jgi:hypothetical protein
MLCLCVSKHDLTVLVCDSKEYASVHNEVMRLPMSKAVAEFVRVLRNKTQGQNTL